MNKNASHLSSGNTELYTPAKYVDAIRRVFGGSIELDPATSEIANQTVKADRIFTAADDGLAQPWIAQSVWMNHPYGAPEQPCKSNCKKKRCQPKSSKPDGVIDNKSGRGYWERIGKDHYQEICVHADEYIPGNPDWIDKLVAEYEAGNVKEAACIVWASTSEVWNFPLQNYVYCNLWGRVQFTKPDGTTDGGSPKASMIVYMGEHPERFAAEFDGVFGRVVVPWHMVEKLREPKRESAKAEEDEVPAQSVNIKKQLAKIHATCKAIRSTHELFELLVPDLIASIHSAKSAKNMALICIKMYRSDFDRLHALRESLMIERIVRIGDEAAAVDRMIDQFCGKKEYKDFLMWAAKKEEVQE